MIYHSSFEFIDGIGSQGYFAQSETELVSEYNPVFHCGVSRQKNSSGHWIA